jgi:fructokinase
MRAKGPALVLVTRGAEGVTAYGGGDPVHHPAPKAEVVDTVGAGDTFNAGFLAGLSDAGPLGRRGARGPTSAEALKTALDLGVRAAAVTVSRAGANPPRRDELAVRALIQRVTRAEVVVEGQTSSARPARAF